MYKLTNKNQKYKIKSETIDEYPINIKKNDKIIEIKKDNKVILKTKVTENVLEKINNKSEINLEDINEKNIKKELNELIQNDKKQITNINNELNKIEEKINKCYKNEYIYELEEKISIMKSKVDSIKEHYQIINDYYEFKGYSDLNNILLINSIEDYKFYKTDKEVDELVIHCKEECKKLNTVIDLTDKLVKNDKKILEVKENNNKRNNDYLENKEKIVLINKLNEKLNKNIKEENDFLEKLDDDIKCLDKKLKDITLFNNSKSLITNIFNISVCTNLMPIFPGVRILFQALILKIVIESTGLLLSSDIKRELITKDLINKYIDKIYSNSDNIKSLSSLLKDNISNIKELKEEFIKKFENYKDVLDDYDKYLNKINESIKKLEEKQKLVLKYKTKLDENKEKILEFKNY